MVNLNSFIMNQHLHIRATLDQPELLVNIVEKLAGRFNNRVLHSYGIPKGLKPVGTSSAEVYLSGNVDFSFSTTENGEEIIRMPFITSFHFTCARSCQDPFRLAWSSSLS
jgi:hypothetical protein